MEKVTFSRVEQFAIAKAREQAVTAQQMFQLIVDDIADAHGIPATDRHLWNLTNAGDALVKNEPPKQPDPPAPPEA